MWGTRSREFAIRRDRFCRRWGNHPSWPKCSLHAGEITELFKIQGKWRYMSFLTYFLNKEIPRCRSQDCQRGWPSAMAVHAVSYRYKDWYRIANPFDSPSGVQFVAVPGTANFVQTWEPKPSDIVTFKHSGFFLQTRKPKNPLLYRVRAELAWQDICNSWKSQTPRMPGSDTSFSSLSYVSLSYVFRYFSNGASN